MRSCRWASALAAVALLVPYSGTAASPPANAVDLQSGLKREVVFAVQRDQRLHVFDARTLDPLGQIAGLNNLLQHVSVSPNGLTLYLAQAATPDGKGCCAVFAFNLATREMCYLIEPAMDSLPSPDGLLLFVQRGSVGIDVFNTRTLARTTIETFDKRRAHENRDRLPLRGHYALHPSSEGRWMLGITLWQKPSLGVFDLWSQTMVRELPIPLATGAWVGKQFYLYANDGGRPSLIAVNAGMTGLGTPRPIASSSPELAASQLPRGPVIAAGDRLLVYQPTAGWLMRGTDAVQSPGIFAIDPATAGLTAHLAPGSYFAQVIAGTEGQRLYALDTGEPSDGGNGPPPRLQTLDARTGAILAERALAPDVWHLTVAQVPASLVPRGEVHPAACRIGGQIPRASSKLPDS
jgi:hypothetical protein